MDDSTFEQLEDSQPGVFHDVDLNQPLKFHIQKDLPEVVLQWLERMIKDNGGQVLHQVPLNGYVLIDPASEKGRHLLEKWCDEAKPERHVVCWTFVPGSVTAGGRLAMDAMQNVTPLFIHNELPVEFYLDDNLGERRVWELRQKLAKYGGTLVYKYSESRIIISDDSKTSFEVLVDKYRHDNNVFVEAPSWIDRCIAFGRCEHTQTAPRIVGGRRPGASRHEYTDEDDQLLVEYIAKRLPSNEMRGRTGNGLYRELCERVDLYPWASRHTWHSWRNRYKTKRARLDRLIDEWLEANPQPSAGKGQYIIHSSKALAHYETAAPAKSPSRDQSSESAEGEHDGPTTETSGTRSRSKRRQRQQETDEESQPGRQVGRKRHKSTTTPAPSDVDKEADAEMMMFSHVSQAAIALV